MLEILWALLLLELIIYVGLKILEWLFKNILQGGILE